MHISRRFLCFALAVIALFSLTACKGTQENPSATKPSVSATEPTMPAKKQVGIVDTDGMTDLQKAVVITAESYWYRGYRIQYDQKSMTALNSTEIGSVGRRSTGLKTPEDYTSQNLGYLDCSSFVYDVYKFALGMSITDGSRNTKGYCTSSIHTILSETPEEGGFDKLSAEELSAKEKEFTDTLQPGDIIVYRSAGNTSGHAMLYVGNNMMLHSSGKDYIYGKGEQTENDGTVRYDSISDLLTPGNKRYLFNKHKYVILRPLNNFKGEIPAETVQRMDLMRCIIAEKHASHIHGKTVNPGDTMTFTFRLTNCSNLDKTLTVTDTLPEHTTYISGADNVKENTLSWTVSIPSGEATEVSYSVKVDDTAPLGEYITSHGNVSGIAVNCPGIKIAKTLSDTQQQAVSDALAQLKNGALRGIELANAVYEQACGNAAITAPDVSTLWAGLTDTYSGNDYTLNTALPYANMVAPNLYGGRHMGELDPNSEMAVKRTRYVNTAALITGDIVLSDDTLYLFNGNELVNLHTAESQDPTYLGYLLSVDRFVVLRPSMTF